MKPNSARHNKLSNEDQEINDELLARFFVQAKAQFGDAVKAFWFYDEDVCPGCLAHPLGILKFKGENTLSINGYIYRPRGLLIGYFLCETCAAYLFREPQRNPYQQTPLHADIERSLIAAYHRYLASLDA